MAFSFGISADSAVRNPRRALAPWGIYDVKFKGCEIREFDGKKDPSQHYKVLATNFENEDGYFSVNKFFPKEGDDVRRTTEGKSGTVTFPSSFEDLMNIVKQTAQILSPKGFEKMQAASSKFRSFDDVAKALIAITDPVKDTMTKIKLIGVNRDGKVVADIPRITALNKQGEAFIADNYIGNKLFFSDYEETKRSEYLKATPTPMKEEGPAKDADPLGVAQPNQANEPEEFDLNSLAGI